MTVVIATQLATTAGGFAYLIDSRLDARPLHEALNLFWAEV